MKRPIPILLTVVAILGALYFFTLPGSAQSSIENKVELMFKQKQTGNSESYSPAPKDTPVKRPETDTLPTNSVYDFKDMKISITQKKPGSNQYYACDSWIKIMRNDSVLYSREFLKMDLEGAGLFVPKVQPLDDYFFIIKHGDYEGIQIIIDANGKVKEIPGGQYFFSTDKKYMFVLQEVDGTLPFRVMDLSTMHFVFHSHKDEYGMDSKYVDYVNAEFYRKGNDIYVSLIDRNEAKTLYKYNFAKNRLDISSSQETGSLANIDLYEFYKVTRYCDCKNNRF